MGRAGAESLKKLECLEEDVRLSDSCLWGHLRDYYLKEGMNAWNGQVPFFITSNVFFAQKSARVMANYCFDLFLKNKFNPNQPIYILELGAGTGQFSFYCLQELRRLWSVLFKSDSGSGSENNFKFVYVISDLTPQNIKFCQQHEKLKTWQEEGWLTCRVLDVDQIENLSQGLWGKEQLLNPLLVVANYLFDSLRQDAFCVQDKKLLESLMTVRVPVDHWELKDLDVNFKKEWVSSENYYSEEWGCLNELLQQYESELDNGHVLIPIGALKLIKSLLRITQHNKLLLLVTDKGYSTLEDFEQEDEPSLISHGSFSFWVNFHALGFWVKKNAGQLMPIPVGEGIKSAVYYWGEEKLNDLPLVREILKENAEEFCLADFFNFYQSFKKSKILSMDALLSLMRWSRWDPYIFRQFSKQIIGHLAETTANVMTGLIEGAEIMISRIYDLPYGEDFYLPIAVMFHALHFYEKAIEIYQQSERRRGPVFLNIFNQALCFHQLGDGLKAQEYFNWAKNLGTPEELKRLTPWLSVVKKDEN